MLHVTSTQRDIIFQARWALSWLHLDMASHTFCENLLLWGTLSYTLPTDIIYKSGQQLKSGLTNTCTSPITKFQFLSRIWCTLVHIRNKTPLSLIDTGMWCSWYLKYLLTVMINPVSMTSCGFLCNFFQWDLMHHVTKLPLSSS